MTRLILSMLGAVVVIAWAVATAIAYARRERPVPAQYREDDVQPYDPETIRRMTFGGNALTLTSSPAVTVSLGGQTFTYASGSSRDWRN